jgi:hypothetical protein
MNKVMQYMLVLLALFSACQGKSQDRLEEEFKEFEQEMNAYRALYRITNGHIVNPHWGMTLFPYPSYALINSGVSGVPFDQFKLKWTKNIDLVKKSLKKGDGSAYHAKEFYQAQGYEDAQTIGLKFIICHVTEYSERSMPPPYRDEYYENPNVMLTESQLNILNDSALNIHSQLWYFIPGLDDELTNLRDTGKIMSDSEPCVLEMIEFAKKMSLEDAQDEASQPIDSNQRFVCKYRIQQKFENDQNHSGIFDNEKTDDFTRLEGYRISKTEIKLSPKEFSEGVITLSDIELNERNVHLQTFGRYAFFYEYLLQHKQAGYWTLENVCLAEIE